MEIKKIAVIGSGTMGAGIAQIAIMNGFDVTVLAIDPVNDVIEKMNKTLAKLVSKGKMTEEEMNNALQNYKVTQDMEQLKDVDLAIEAIFEDVEVKKDCFKKLDSICKKETILASNTSSISITNIACTTNRPEKVIGMHFFNPVPVMKLLEIVTSDYTSDDTLNTIITVGEKMGKVIVKSVDKAGFIVNRILIPYINEAIFMLEEGVATKEDIDKGVMHGGNHPMGPLALADLIGLDVVLAIMDVLYSEFADSKYRPAPLLRRMVRAKKLGRKTGKGFFEYN